jgi:hypothetical protein
MQTGFQNFFQTGDLFMEVSSTFGAQPIWTAPLVSTYGTYPATFLQPGDRAVKGTGAEANSGKLLYVSHYCVAMLRAIGQARQDK